MQKRDRERARVSVWYHSTVSVASKLHTAQAKMLKQHDVVSEKVHVLQPMTPQKTTCNQTMKTPTDAKHTLVRTARTAHFKPARNAEPNGLCNLALLYRCHQKYECFSHQNPLSHFKICKNYSLATKFLDITFLQSLAACVLSLGGAKHFAQSGWIRWSHAFSVLSFFTLLFRFYFLSSPALQSRAH